MWEPPPMLICWVPVRDLTGGLTPATFLRTDLTAWPTLGSYLARTFTPSPGGSRPPLHRDPGTEVGSCHCACHAGTPGPVLYSQTVGR